MASNYKLSEGSMKIIMQGGQVSEPVLQVLSNKRIPASHSFEKERYRIYLSDGQHKISHAILTSQAIEHIGSVCPEENSIIKLVKYSTNLIKNSSGREDTRIVLMLAIEIVAQGSLVGGVIGNPINYSDSSSNDNAPPATKIQKTDPVVVRANNYPPQDLNQSLVDTKVISPIASLSPYHNKWVIRARVSNKSNIRSWANSRGEGKLFSVDLIDESGEIRCTAFRDLVDKFYDYMEVDKVYYISKCQLKPVNRQFCTLKCEYEMTMTAETIVERCDNDQGAVPQTRYDFVPLDKVASMEPGTIVGNTEPYTPFQMFIHLSRL